MRNTKKSVHIVDFGGACGIHYFEIQRFFSSEFDIKWTVIETTEMTEAAKKHIIGYPNLEFKNNLQEVNEHIDMIYSSSALSYTNQPYHFLKKLLQVKANYILFNRMMFNEKDRDIITLQESTLASNGPGDLPLGYQNAKIKYPHTTLSLSKFNNLITEHYLKEWIFEEKSGAHQINSESIIGMGMLLKTKP